jgi:hypothetical protein
LSYRDVHEAVAHGAFPHLAQMGLATGEGAIRVLATWLINVASYAATAMVLGHLALTRFDRAVGRPLRASAAREGECKCRDHGSISARGDRSEQPEVAAIGC